MKLLIASDIHGAAGYCRQLLDAWDREGADRLLLLGDVLYHGPRNDLPPDYAPKEVIALLNARKDKIFCVRGNCDTEVDQMVLEFPILADYAVFTAGRRLVYAAFGNPDLRRLGAGGAAAGDSGGGRQARLHQPRDAYRPGGTPGGAAARGVDRQ